ncbi:MAG: TPM domain-containing protein [Tissierellia bacterium]|nr:TPM domain-containing protein [Tissierellia bacterium]
MKKNRLFSLLLAIFLLGFAGTSKAQPEIPPAPTNYYYDELGVLSDSTKSLLRETNKELEQKTGSQVMIATIGDLEGYPVFDYSVDLFNQWKLGDEKKDNGILILLAEDHYSGEKNSYIEIRVGYGLEGALNDGKVGRIIDQFMMPEFQNGQLDRGLVKGFKAIVGEIAKEYNVEITGDFEEYSDALAEQGGPSIITILIVLILIYYLTKGNGPRGGGYYRRPRGGYYGGWSSRGGGSSFGGGFSGGGGSTGGGGAGRSF